MKETPLPADKRSPQLMEKGQVFLRKIGNKHKLVLQLTNILVLEK
jgi:hypothetical protein